MSARKTMNIAFCNRIACLADMVDDNELSSPPLPERRDTTSMRAWCEASETLAARFAERLMREEGARFSKRSGIHRMDMAGIKTTSSRGLSACMFNWRRAAITRLEDAGYRLTPGSIPSYQLSIARQPKAGAA